MAQWIDHKYALLLSNRFDRFSSKNNTMNFRCPYCGDSRKDKTKARGFLLVKKQEYFYYCHNCHVSRTFSKFLEEQDPGMHKEYVFELIKEKAGTLVSGKYFYGYTAGLTFFIAVFATNLFDQGIWQRVYSAKSNKDLVIGFASAFFVVLPFLFILGFFGILAVITGNAKDPSTVFFSLILNPMTGSNSILTITILTLVISLVVSSMDGATHVLSESISPVLFGSMITRAGGGSPGSTGASEPNIEW